MDDHRGYRQPDRSDVKECSKCPQAIVWRHTFTRDKPMPLEWPPEKRAVIGSNGKVYIVDTFVPHWANCPGADSFREKG